MTINYCFPEGRFKALTMSYDDGKIEDRRLVSIFNHNNIKGTFNLNSGLTEKEDKIPLSEVKTLYEGHEVAVHTVNHPTLERCPLTEVVNEVMEDRKNLELVVGYPVRGMAYPNGSYSEEIVSLLPKLGVEYSRVVGNSGNFYLPGNYHKWMATCHHNHRLMDLAEEFVEAKKSQYMNLFYVWGHSYEFSMNNNWELIEGFCEYVGNRDEVWYATNIQIVDYRNACHLLKVSAAGTFAYNPTAIDLWISVNQRVIKVPAGQQVSLT